MSRPITPPDGVDEPIDGGPHRPHTDHVPAAVSPERRPADDPLIRPDDRAASSSSAGPGHTPGVAGPPVERDPAPAAAVAPGRESTGPPPARVDHRAVLVGQRERFGGVKVGSAFFGWLTATGLAAILVAVLAAVGVATGTTADQAGPSGTGAGRAWSVGLVGGIVLLVIVFVAYLAGGYVAGRMARFNGARQGLAVWVWGVLIAGLLAVVAAVAGSQYDVLAQLNLPQIRIGDSTWAPQTLVAIVVAAAVALVGALLGGLAGMRFHRRVDRADVVPSADIDAGTR